MNRPIRVAPVLACLALLPLSGCFHESKDSGPDISGPGDSVAATDSISLSGKISSSDGHPLPGFIVRLARIGLADTTDGEGPTGCRGAPGPARAPTPW
jgi:hypothetical protein